MRKFAVMKRKTHISHAQIPRMAAYVGITTLLLAFANEAGAQSRDKQRRAQVDSLLAARYYRKGGIDTAYLQRPTSKWTITAKANVSGMKIQTEGNESDNHFTSEIKSDRKATISVGVSYVGLSLSLSLNPAKLAGKYHDYEFNFRSYGKRFGFDFSYQDAKNFTGWHEHDGLGRIDLPTDILSVKTLNMNAFYVFNHRRFSYPAAFSQSYIQRRSAGSFLLTVSAQGQQANLDGEQTSELEMMNIGIGGGYGYNYVPAKGWLLHISAQPTFIVYSKTSLTFSDSRVPLRYHFPEAIITGRSALVRHWGNKFLGMSAVYNFTAIGHKDNLAVHNTKWRVQTFFGVRL